MPAAAKAAITLLAQSLHLHGWALGQRVFGQTSNCSVLTILNMLRRPAVPSPLLLCMPDM